MNRSLGSRAFSWLTLAAMLPVIAALYVWAFISGLLDREISWQRADRFFFGVMKAVLILGYFYLFFVLLAAYDNGSFDRLVAR